MKCWIGSCNIETVEGTIQRFNSCFITAFCIDQCCNIMGPTEQTSLGEVNGVDMEKTTRVVRWLKTNCKHPKRDRIINHVCALADTDAKVLLPYELKAKIERLFCRG